MEERREHEFKSPPVDLARRGLELESIFSSVINQIPDLVSPPIFRLAGEDDFFDRTKHIKLSAAKERRTIGLQAGEIRDTERKESVSHEKSKRSKDPISRAERTHIQCSDVTKQASMRQSSKQNPKRRSKPDSRAGWNVDPKEQAEKEERYRFKVRLNRRYSRIKLRKSPDIDEDYKIGYDRLFAKKPDPNYPFASPMPECMLTEHNIDNLRDIIVSSQDIEWKMLTPVRPVSEYEEKYFDKLISLHRLRYKSRYEANYFRRCREAPFKLSRHTYLLQHIQPKLHSSTLSIGAKFKSKFRARSERARSIGHLKLTIPKVTLTSDERPNEQIFTSEDDDQSVEDVREFNYQYFSRFSRQNLRISYSQSGESSDEKERSDEQVKLSRPRQSSASSQRSNGSQLEVEEVMYRLMDTEI